MLVVSPLVALMADQVAQCCSCAVARYVMLCQCGCRLRNQTFLGNKSRIGNSPLLLSREGVAPRGYIVRWPRETIAPRVYRLKFLAFHTLTASLLARSPVEKSRVSPCRIENSRVSRRFWSVHRWKILAFHVDRFAFGAFTG